MRTETQKWTVCSEDPLCNKNKWCQCAVLFPSMGSGTPAEASKSGCQLSAPPFHKLWTMCCCATVFLAPVSRWQKCSKPSPRGSESSVLQKSLNLKFETLLCAWDKTAWTQAGRRQKFDGSQGQKRDNYLLFLVGSRAREWPSNFYPANQHWKSSGSKKQHLMETRAPYTKPCPPACCKCIFTRSSPPENQCNRPFPKKTSTDPFTCTKSPDHRVLQSFSFGGNRS